MEPYDGTRRQPYGTREGDIWLGPGAVQELLDAEGEGKVLVHEMMVKDGVLDEFVYVTTDPELIERATHGHELWMAQVASEN